MIYGYEQPIQLPTIDLYDKLIMAMALNAAKDMYDRNELQLKDFYKTYGDFLTPIAADLAWWDANMSGAARRKVNEIYARGGDPLRNRADMAELQAFVNSRPYAQAALMKLSAENARLYLKARMELEAKGLYNPLMAKYDGPDLSTFSTALNGVWDKMSPTPFENVATFSNPYYEGMKPNIHKESKNGIDYDVEQITDEDLKAIADAHHNELVSTPQGQMMYKYYQDIARANGSTDVDKDAREMFNAAIADSQHRRTYRKDSYNDNYYKAEDLKFKRSSNTLDWKKFELDKQEFDWRKEKEQQELELKAAKMSGDTGGEGTSLSGLPLAQMWYDKGVANSLSAGGITLTWDLIHNNYGAFSKEIYDLAIKFGQRAIGGTPAKMPTKDDLMNTEYAKKHKNQLRNALDMPKEKRTPDLQMLVDHATEEWNSKNGGSSKGSVPTNEVKVQFKNQYTITMAAEHVAKAIGDTVSGNDRVVQASLANVERLFGENDVITGTAGYTRVHESDDTKELRDAINKYGAKNTRITPMGDGYASLRKNGKFEVMPRVRVQVVDDNGDIKYNKDAYYSIGVSGLSNKQGAYIGGAVKHRTYDPNQKAMEDELRTIEKELYTQIYMMHNPDGTKDPVVMEKIDKLQARRELLKNEMKIYDENFVGEHYEGDHSLYPDYDNWFLLGDWARHDISLMK